MHENRLMKLNGSDGIATEIHGYVQGKYFSWI